MSTLYDYISLNFVFIFPLVNYVTRATNHWGLQKQLRVNTLVSCPTLSKRYPHFLILRSSLDLFVLEFVQIGHMSSYP